MTEPAELRAELQTLAQDLQMAAQQVVTVNAQVRELEGSLEALQKQPKERPVYRQVGPLLLEVEDRDELITELRSSIEKLQQHQRRLEEGEQQLRERYEQVVEQFEGSA